MRVAITAFTRRGVALAQRVACALQKEGEQVQSAYPRRLAEAFGQPGYPALTAWAGERFGDCEALLFVGACGIAVRAVAPWVRDKRTDPAVVAVDEAGRWAVPLLSGHVGGANALARRVAAFTGGAAAISTATDVNGVFAVDVWAQRKGLFLDGREAAKQVSSRLLEGETVGLYSALPTCGAPPEGVVPGPNAVGIWIADTLEPPPFPVTVQLVPPTLTLGIGCRRDSSAQQVERAVQKSLEGASLHPRAVFQVSTIDRKGDEPGLLAFCEHWKLPLVTWTPEELRETPGNFTPSAFVRSVTGVDNVCERAAVRAGGALVLPKRAEDGVTVAVARRRGTISLDGEEGMVWD